MRGKANMNIVLANASELRRTDPDFEAALVGNAALGQSGAFLALRQARARHRRPHLPDLLALPADRTTSTGCGSRTCSWRRRTSPRRCKSTQEVIAQYARDGATDAEVAVQKSFFAGNFKVGLGTNGGVADALIFAEKFGFGPKYLDEYPARINAVTTAQANAAMRKHFYADRLNLIVAGDLDKLPE